MFRKKKEEPILKYPTHMAFIVDGNRRWAKERGLNSMLGHKKGAFVLRDMVYALEKLGKIPYVSFFTFSTENWKREKTEIDYLFDIIRQFFSDMDHDYENHKIKVVFMGDLSALPEDMQKLAHKLENKVLDEVKLTVFIGLNYGGRADIVQAANKVAATGEKITEQNLAANLYSAPAPDLDLVIRTSGEMRISNFMLFQMAYAELYFPKIYWPDFDENELHKALVEFSKRNRRYGGGK